MKPGPGEALADDGKQVVSWLDFMLQGLIHIGDPKPEAEAEAE